MRKPTYYTNIDMVKGLSEEEKREIKKVTEKYPFKANDFYLNLINWDDKNDPIRRLIIPSSDELTDWGDLDASSEHLYTKAPGMEHKYRDTALILVSQVCGGQCRYCFRKRIFLDGGSEIVDDFSGAIEYIRNHKEINNVLLTGGDALVLSTGKLEKIIKALREIDHVNIIRLGSKMLAFYPFRVSEDPELIEILKKYSTKKKRIYVMAHFNNVNEISEGSLKAIDMLLKAGVIICNQAPLIAGINDNADALVNLFNKLSYIGVPPYYIFQCRPTKGNFAYSVPIEKGFSIFNEAISKVSGLGKRARYMMSHKYGKIGIVGLDDEYVYMKFHRAANPTNYKKLLKMKRNKDARWLDDYGDALAQISE